MKRNIIKIDQEKCNGCGICVNACHEGALQMIDGKARLISESYCDGLGACLPECPTGALTIEERETVAFDEETVKKNMMKIKKVPEDLPCGCPGTHSRKIERNHTCSCDTNTAPASSSASAPENIESQLRQWPCQIKLVSPHAPYFDNASLLVAADCTAFAYGSFHNDFMKNKITIIGCPKLDATDYSEKLADILTLNDIKDITVLRMEVPCCGGMVSAVKNAMLKSGKMIPWQVVTVTTSGEIIR